MFDARVPSLWKNISWESSTLGFWFTKLLERNCQFDGWLFDGRPQNVLDDGLLQPSELQVLRRSRGHITAAPVSDILLRGEDEGYDEAVEPQHLGEDEDQDHAHEEAGLLGCAPHASVTHDANGKAGGQAAEAHTQASTQMAMIPAMTTGMMDFMISSGRITDIAAMPVPLFAVPCMNCDT
ncbi:hypothetical protein CRUP_038073 [Coryphaenoides rupestris]|nr:hypothetical protein CRUP_038073 [Coryphaenoides rupestris]